jgi:hypothetical protein
VRARVAVLVLVPHRNADRHRAEEQQNLRAGARTRSPRRPVAASRDGDLAAAKVTMTCTLREAVRNRIDTVHAG